MMSSRPLLSSLAASLALCALHASISTGVARPRRRIDFSRLNSLRLESPFESFEGGLLSVLVAMGPAPCYLADHGDRTRRRRRIWPASEATDDPRERGCPRLPQV